MSTCIGFRGLSFCFTELQSYFNIQKVSYSCVRQWILRLGFGLLHQPVPKRKDWIYIIDFSIQLGRERCLLILGVTRQSLIENGYALKHHQLCVLDIYVQEHFKGEIVHERLLNVQDKTGVPYQIISDNGADVRKGVEMMCTQNPQIIYSNDITHMIGNFIKHWLHNNPQWLSLQDDLCNLAQQVKQTELSFLRPIALSKKARWLNIKQELEWLEHIFKYEGKGDFSLIAKGYKIENTECILNAMFPNGNKSYQAKHLQRELRDTTFATENDAMQWLKEKGYTQYNKVKIIDAGKARFNEKFGFLGKYKQFFQELQQLNQMAEHIKGLVRNNGLSLNTLQNIEKKYDNITYPLVKKVYFDIVNYMVDEHAKCGIDNTPMLCCSDIIESIFGKFKMKIKQTVGGIYETVLSIAIICNELSDELIKSILSTVRMADVEKWFLSMAGLSNLAKRRIAFG